eukprot:4192712-Prymnesium_polylepis.1
MPCAEAPHVNFPDFLHSSLLQPSATHPWRGGQGWSCWSATHCGPKYRTASASLPQQPCMPAHLCVSVWGSRRAAAGATPGRVAGVLSSAHRTWSPQQGTCAARVHLFPARPYRPAAVERVPESRCSLWP